MGDTYSEILDSLAGQFVENLTDKDHPNPRVTITFAGVPGSGKSTIAEYLSEQLQGLLIKPNAIQLELSKKIPRILGDKLESYTRMIALRMMRRLMTFQNRTFIIDISLNRQRLARLKELSIELRIPIIVIKLQPQRHVIDQRLQDDKHYSSADIDAAYHELAMLEGFLSNPIDSDGEDKEAILDEVQARIEQLPEHPGVQMHG